MPSVAEKKFFGGSRTRQITVTGASLTIYDPRVQVIDPTVGGGIVTIPLVSTIPTLKLGGPIFYILNKSATYSFDVSDGLAFLFTLAPMTGLTLSAGATGWVYRHSAVGGGAITPPPAYWGSATLDATIADLISVWKLDDVSAPLVTETPDSNDLAPTGASAPAPEFRLVGKNQYAMSPRRRAYANSGTLPIGLSDDFTVAVWHYTRIDGDRQEYGIPILYFDANNWVRLEFYPSTPGMSVYTASFLINTYLEGSFVGTIPENTWHLILLIKAGNVYSFYLDNNLVGSNTRAGWNPATAPKIMVNSIGVPVAAESDVASVFDEMTIWKKALSTGERTALWNAGSGLFYTQP